MTNLDALTQIEALISGGDRPTVNEQNAFENFTALNRLLMQIRDIARAPVDARIERVSIHLVPMVRALLRYTNPCNVAEGHSQQWQAVSHECDVIERATLRAPSVEVRTEREAGHDEAQGFAASLRQQAQWIDESREGKGSVYQRITMDDIDTDEMRGAADFIDRLAANARLGVLTATVRPGLGDIVRIKEGTPYFHDWRGMELQLISLAVEPNGKLWASVIDKNDAPNTRHRGFGVYDGETTDFEHDHLELAPSVPSAHRGGGK